MAQKYTTFRELGVCIVLLSAIFLFAGCLPQPHTTSLGTSAPVLYPASQGIYESCSPVDGNSCLQHLKAMSAAGFTVVVNYNQLYGTAAQEIAYASEAHKLGMQIIWGMSIANFWNGNGLLPEYKDLAATCDCATNTAFTEYVVNLVKKLPATWGYYIGDEVTAENHDAFKAFADLVKQIDPVHPRLFIAGENASTMGANVRPFADTAEVIGGDIYPISTSDSISSVGEIAHTIQSIADQNGDKSAIVLQAFSWGEYPKDTWVCSVFPSCARFPTADEMRLMRNLATSNSNARLLLWYSYFDISRSDNPTGHMKDLIEAARSPIDVKSP